MKKLLMNASLICMAFGADGMELTRVGDMRLSGGGGVSDMLAVRSPGDEIVRDIVETLRLEEFLLTDGLARLSFVKGTETDGIFVRGDEVFEKSYPCVKDFLELAPADASHSFAVYKLWADTEELGRIKLSERHVDSEHPLEHQTRVLSSVKNGESQSTTRAVQTFVELDGKEIIVTTEETIVPVKETRIVPTKKNSENTIIPNLTSDDLSGSTSVPIIWKISTLYTFEQYKNNLMGVREKRMTVADHVRGDGEVFDKNWVPLTVIRKPAPPRPPMLMICFDGSDNALISLLKKEHRLWMSYVQSVLLNIN
jgi:hypothetical protein